MSGGDAFWHPLPSSGVGGGSSLLEFTSYSPASDTNIQPGSSSFSDVDATNLALTLTVPSSGRVLVILTSRIVAVGTEVYWNLRTTAGVEVVGSRACVGFTTGNAQPRVTHRIWLEGLTPGSVTWRWGHAATAGGTRYGGFNGPAVMEAWGV